MQSGFPLSRRGTTAESVRHQTAHGGTLTALERLTVGLLAAMVPIWILFQVLVERALFPPIGPVYALGSIAVASAMLRSRKRWSPAVAAGWGVTMMLPESIPAIPHLLHWNDIYTHFAHYVLIMTFFPLAIALVATGIGATVQNYRRDEEDRRAPGWLRDAALGVASLILVANAVTLVLHAYRIP